MIYLGIFNSCLLLHGINKATRHTEVILEHTCLLFFTTKVILGNKDPVFKQIWSLTVVCQKTYNMFSFGRIIPKERD